MKHDPGVLYAELIPIPELVPRLPEILPGTGHRTRPLETHTRPPHEIVDAVRRCQLNPEGYRSRWLIGLWPVFHAQRLGRAHLDQRTRVLGLQIACRKTSQ